MKLRRLTLTRRDTGQTYLNRWGFETKLGGVYLHHIGAPDPGVDLHDHPWWFASIILRGAYVEYIRDRDGDVSWRPRPRWSLRSIRLDQAHHIAATASHTWTLVFRGPRVRTWGFYVDGRFVPDTEYVNRGLDVDGIGPDQRKGNTPL